MSRGVVVSKTIVYAFICVFFFFQAEDGIRDLIVTGVQTCALPIWLADITYVDANEGWLVLRKNRAGQICARSQRHFGDPEIQPKPAQTWSPKRCCLACDKQPTILIPKRPVVQAFLKS